MHVCHFKLWFFTMQMRRCAGASTHTEQWLHWSDVWEVTTDDDYEDEARSSQLLNDGASPRWTLHTLVWIPATVCSHVSNCECGHSMLQHFKAFSHLQVFTERPRTYVHERQKEGERDPEDDGSLELIYPHCRGGRPVGNPSNCCCGVQSGALQYHYAGRGQTCL